MRNKMDLLGGYLNGLNLNPIPLEFGQSISTTKELLFILAKIDQVITFTNEWYDNILNDLEGEGLLYQKLSDEFLTSFGADITAIQGSINNINDNITNLSDLITALQYVKPNVILTTSPSITQYSVGDTINSVMLNYNIIKGTNNLVKAEIYKNGSLLTTISNLINGVNSYVDGTPMTTDTEYYVKVYDDIGNVDSNKIDFNFDYKIYYGKLTNETINQTLINSLTNTLFNSDVNITFNLNDEKIIIATYDTLNSIIDSENYDMIDSFTKTTLNLTINGNTTPYNIYVSTNNILDSNVPIIIKK
jgi:hypothetical protein